MALVAYDYESGSENEEDTEEEISSSSVVIVNNSVNEDKESAIGDITVNKEVGSNGVVDAVDESTDKLPGILSQLPEIKKSTVNILEDTLEDFVPKYQPPPKEKKSQKVKITIPALSEFEEEEEPVQKKPKTSSKGSSLLSMLPPVRGTIISTKSFIPNVLKNKPTSTNKKNNTLLPQAVRKKAEEAKMATIKKISKLEGQSDNESDDDIEIPETFDDETWQKVCGPKSKYKPPIIEAEEEIPLPVINIAPEPVKPYDGLDNAAFKELVGKAKRPVNIKLIDINEEEILPDQDIWLTKSLTDPDAVPPKKVEEPLDPTKKKKHHITYLAEQAKANEQELQGSWSANKFARNQTRAKYGF